MSKTTIAACLLMGVAVAAQADEGSAGGGLEPALWAVGDTQATAANGRPAADAGIDPGSKGSGYIDANYSLIFAGDHTLQLHAGHKKVGNFHLLSHADYRIGVTKPLGTFTLGVAYARTNAIGNNLYRVRANGEDRNLRGGVLALSVNRLF